MEENTRSIWVADPAERSARNESTVFYDLRSPAPTVPSLPPRAPSTIRGAFTANFRRIRSETAQRESPGVCIAVCSADAVHATAWIHADESVRSAVIGRHGRADLFVPGDPSLSLRHLLVFVTRSRDGAVRTRIIDPRSGGGARDEADRRFETLEAEGPAFVRAASFAVFCIPTPTGLWPDDGEAVWESLPPRAFLDRRDPTAPHRRAPPREATVTLHEGPMRDSAELVREGETPLGTLHVASPSGRSALAVGPAAAGRGVLLGRSARCDGAGRGAFADDSLSRVHAILLALGGEIHLADIASTNGTFHGEPRERLRGAISLTGSVMLGAVSARWEAA